MIYRYKATIPGSKSFMREYEVVSDTTLFKFNTYIMNDLDFSPDQIVLFCGLSEDGNVCSRYGMFDLGFGSIDRVSFETVVAKGEKELQYFYDLRNNKYLTLTLEGEYEETPRYSYPRTIAEKGRNPEQFAGKYQDWDSVDESSMIGQEEEVMDLGGDSGDE